MTSTPPRRRFRTASTLALALVTTAVLGLSQTPVAAASGHATTSVRPGSAARPVSACALIGAGRINGLRTRPAHVTIALAGKRGDTVVRVTECRRVTRTEYRQIWSAAGHVGRAGFAPAGDKREGDGRTPSGVYTLGPAFGARNPGSNTGYLRLHPDSCWGSTVGSSRYNRYFRGVCGPADETMYNDVAGAYAQGMVIGYNTRPVRQGRGSAIFFHVSTGGPTAGCVSMNKAKVVDLIRRTRPGDVIAMGTIDDLVRS